MVEYIKLYRIGTVVYCCSSFGDAFVQLYCMHVFIFVNLSEGYYAETNYSGMYLYQC